MKKSLFVHTSYKDFLKEYIQDNRKSGLIGELAKAAGCDRTYFSQMLNSKVQLTPDHGNGLCEYFGFAEAEEEYFHLLLTRERAATKSFQNRLSRKITELQKRSLNLSENMKNKTERLSTEAMMTYYSDWRYAAIHLLTSVDEFQTADKISEKLEINKAKIRKLLNELTDLNLVKKDGARYVHSGKNIHVPRNSPHNLQNHLNWRMKALEQVHNEENIHYTSVFTISRSDWPNFRNQLLNFLEAQRKDIGKSGSEEIYCFCADLFEVSRT